MLDVVELQKVTYCMLFIKTRNNTIIAIQQTPSRQMP